MRSKNILNHQFAANMKSSQRYGRREPAWFQTSPVNFGDTNRNDSASYGYPDQIDFYFFYNMYNRSGFAKALIDIIPVRCFAEGFNILDGEDDNTEFVNAANDFNEQFKMHSVWEDSFKKRDLGQYSTIVPIFTERDSQAELSKPLINAASVLNVNPFYQPECEGSTTYVDDYNDKDWNKPEYYKLYPSALTGRQTTNATQIDLHRSRVFVLTTAVGSLITGNPALEAPYNAIFDANKIRGAAAEGYRKNAKQRTVMSANNPQAAQALGKSKEEIDNSVDDWENGINNALTVAGIDVNSLQSDLQDPTGAFTIALQEACASRGVPVTELIGFMTGERSSTQNSSAFSKRLKSTQKNDYGVTMVEFYQWLVDLSVLPKPKNKIVISWPDIAEPTTAEKLENSKSMMEQNELSYKSGKRPIWADSEVREIVGYEKEKPKDEFEDIDPKQDLKLED